MSGGKRSAVASLLALFSLLVLLAPAGAAGDGRIGGESGSAAGQNGRLLEGLAVSTSEGGDLYVTDPENQRIDQYTPAGAFVRAFGWMVDAEHPEERLQTCTLATGCLRGTEGSGPGQLDWSDAIAVDNDPASASYGDVYLVDQRNFRVEKIGPTGEFLLMFGGEVDKTPGTLHPDLCTKADLAAGDTCGAGIPGTGPAHFYEEDPPTGGGGTFAIKSWFKEGDSSIAIGPEGTVYIGDYGRVQEFSPEGAFAGEFKPPVGTGEEPQFVSALAVDSSGNIYERSETQYRDGSPNTEVPGVREFGPAPVHAFIQTFDTGSEETGSEPTHIALDASGDVFASDLNGGSFVLRAFKPDGTLYAEFTSEQAQLPGASTNPGGISVGDMAGDLYATSAFGVGSEGADVAVVPLPETGPSVASDEHVTETGPSTATLHSVVNPMGFDTEYRFEYVDQESFATEGGFSSPHTQVTDFTDLGLVSREDPVRAGISGLATATTYHYRVIAKSHCNETVPSEVCTTDGADATFETLPSTSIRGFTTQTVGPELVTLKAELDPNGQRTTFTIRYGEEEGSYSSGSSEGSLPIGDEFKAVTATFTGLRPDTEYHYQLIAVSANGEDVETVDQTFITERSGVEERAEENCPNSNLREEDNSTALPDCRAYEQVSPSDKNGYGATPANLLAAGGERDAFQSVGAFAGATAISGLGINEYVAHRTSSGWITQSTETYAPGLIPVRWFDFSADLGSWIFQMAPGSSGSGSVAQVKSGFIYKGDIDGSFGRATPFLSLVEGKPVSEWATPIAVSADLATIFIGNHNPLLGSDPLPGCCSGSGGQNRIYEVSDDGAGEPTLSLVAEVPIGLPTEGGCRIDEANQAPTNGRGVSWDTPDGNTLLYTAPIELSPGSECGEGTPNPTGLFARIGDAGAIQLNAPPPSQCHSSSPCFNGTPATPYYYGVSAEGSSAWFTTAQPLIDADTDSTNDLYIAKLENGHVAELVQASTGEAGPAHPTPGQGADVKGVLGVSEDSNRASFVATGVLTTHENGLQEAAVQGADNLYVYDAQSGETRFVTRLCSGPEESGSVADSACPADLDTNQSHVSRNDAGLWLPGGRPGARLTPDGRYLVFDSFGRLTPDDTDNVADVYRYDSQTGRLIRLSFGRNGNDGDGNDEAYPATIRASTSSELVEAAVLAEDDSRSISSDGSTVVFETEAPLVSQDTDEAPDVYEWEEQGHGTCAQTGGCISLVSSGLGRQGAGSGVVSASGRDISFYTPRGLVPADTDGVGDVYDARVEGGFHAPGQAEPCGGAEACHAGAGQPPAAPKVTTPEFVGPGNAVQQLRCAKAKVRHKRHGQVRCVSKHHHKKHHEQTKRHPQTKRRHHRPAANPNRGGAK
jgi:hypothetical protein